MREQLARLREAMGARRQLLPGREGSASAPPRTGPRWRAVTRLPNRIISSLVLIGLALSLTVSAAGLDGFLHRGVTYGVAAEGSGVGGARLGMNAFLEKEADRNNIVRSVEMLREAGVTYVRQSFPWQEIEPAPGAYREWEKYDFIVNQLTGAGIGILARVDTIPRWARPPTDDFERWDKGPPQDFNNYANFVGVLAERYRGKIQHFQVWNEPNLTGEWGGKPIDPAQYGLLLQFTWKRVKQIDPAIQIVTAGLAQTTEDGVSTNNLNELDFIRGLYESGAQPYFDILSVMNYGLGDSPEDRRVGPERTNFSRLLLVRELMEKYGDEAKPVWISEYGWISLPPEWEGDRRTTWGVSVDEETQARWTVEGIERMRREWPWVGAVFVWAFRWVEPPTDTVVVPARHFEVVDYDFTPRPVYLALQEWSENQAVVTSGALPVTDSRIRWTGDWRDQRLGGRDYRFATTEGQVARVAFQGTEVRLRARVGPSEGRLYVAIDGRPVPGLSRDEGGSYIPLRDLEVDFAEVTIASGLRDGTHQLELRSGSTGPVALDRLLIGRQQPFSWTGSFLFVAGLAGLFAGLFRLLRSVVTALGWVAEAGPVRRAAPAWWDTRE
jgi:hypothetical protein